MASSAAGFSTSVAVKRFRQTFVDSIYFVIDIIPTTIRMHSQYGAFQKYINNARKGKITSDDFADVDATELRRMVDMYMQVRGPLTGFDMRYFYYVYAVMIGYVLWTGFSNMGKSNPAFQSDMTLTERRQQFGKDYVEELRPVTKPLFDRMKPETES